MTAEIKSGNFRSTETDVIDDLIRSIEKSKSDWAMCRDLIAVRCHENPENYRIVVARVIHETEDRVDIEAIRKRKS
jgi:hypothetical protein